MENFEGHNSARAEQLVPESSESPSSVRAVANSEAMTHLDAFRVEVSNHPIWGCPLLRHSENCELTRADLAHVFAQYYRYSMDFTRYLAALMTNCRSDYYRSLLARNIWEEGGMLQPEARHAEIYRAFLREGLGVEPTTIKYESFSERFAAAYLNECTRRSPLGAAAFLALGTEGIVSRLYGVFYKNLRSLGLNEDALRFFSIHMECDDEHAASLAELVWSYHDLPNWQDEVREATNAALDLRLEFFNALFESVQQRRIRGILCGIEHRLPTPAAAEKRYVVEPKQSGEALYRNCVPRLNVEFSVERIAFGAEVLDPRVLYIPGLRRNERHKHAHESLLIVLEGAGRVLIGERWLEVKAGDCAFIPRWVLHQTENLQDTEMVILAVTDFGLTEKALVGSQGYRAQGAEAALRARDGEHEVSALQRAFALPSRQVVPDI